MHSDPMHRVSRRGTICEPVIFGENIDQVGCCPSCTIWRDVPVLLGLLNHHFYGSISIVCTHYWRRTPENFGSFTYFYWKQSTVKKTISAYVTLNCLVDLTRFRRTLNFMDKRTDSVCSAGAFSSLTIRYFCSSKNLGLLSARFPLMINFRSAAGFDLREVQLRFSISPILTFRSYPWIWGPPRGSSAKYHINVNSWLIRYKCKISLSSVPMTVMLASLVAVSNIFSVDTSHVYRPVISTGKSLKTTVLSSDCSSWNEIYV